MNEYNRPVPLSRGIKQGDSISSQLYIMSIEPLLMRLRNEPLFQGITLPLDGTIKLTAYADDVNLYVTKSSDINIINSILSTYQSVSNQGLPNLIGRWLPTGQPSITIWLPNNDWWLPNSARHKMLTFGG